MKKLCIVTSLLLFSILIFTGCNTTRRGSTSASSLNKIIRSHGERLSELNFQIKQLSETNNQAVRKLNEMTRTNAALTKQVATLEKNVSNLGKAIDADKNNRRAESERLLKEVAKQTTAAINTRTATLQKQNTRRSGGPPTKGSFYEYTVQPGATLGAIAKAYKVSVLDIKNANKLKSDIIRVGQKLYIPKK